MTGPARPQSAGPGTGLRGIAGRAAAGSRMACGSFLTARRSVASEPGSAPRGPNEFGRSRCVQDKTHHPFLPPDLRSASPADVFGRGTAAGRLLNNLYGGDLQGREAGLRFSERNIAMHKKALAAGKVPPPLHPPKPPPPPRPTVRVPRVGAPPPPAAPAARLSRRPAEAILLAMARDRPVPPPVPRGPLLDDAEKQRLAQTMQHRGRPPSPPACPPPRQAASRGTVAELEQLFRSVQGEVAEREALLEALRSEGAPPDGVEALRARNEIRERVDEMTKINRMIEEAERG